MRVGDIGITLFWLGRAVKASLIRWHWSRDLSEKLWGRNACSSLGEEPTSRGSLGSSGEGIRGVPGASKRLVWIKCGGYGMESNGDEVRRIRRSKIMESLRGHDEDFGFYSEWDEKSLMKFADGLHLDCEQKRGVVNSTILKYCKLKCCSTSQASWSQVTESQFKPAFFFFFLRLKLNWKKQG